MKEEKSLVINITTGTIVRAILLFASVFLLYFIRDVILIILFAVVVASGVYPAANWFQKRKVPRTLAVVIVYLIGFILLGFVFYLIVPTIFSEFVSFAGQIGNYVNQPFRQDILAELMALFPSSLANLFQNLASKSSEYIASFTSGFLTSAAKVFGGVVSFILIIVLSFYLSVQERGIQNFLRVVTPIQYEDYILDLWSRSRKKIGRWLQGQMLLALIVGVLSFLGLSILGVDYALTFALVAGFFEIIPIFGPILAAIPPALTALAVSPILALKVIILYIIIQQFENHLIYPLVVRKIVGIPPILTILAIVIGAELGGFMGVLLSMPLMTVLVEILHDIDLKKHPAEISAASSSEN